MFLQAGFNGRNYRTGIRGWTRHVRDEKRRFRPAELREFVCGDYFWHGRHPDGGGFMAWGEQCVLGSWHGFDLPWVYQEGLAHCDVETRKEHPEPDWARRARAELEQENATAEKRRAAREARAHHQQHGLFQ